MYQVTNIRQDKPKSGKDVYEFLQTFLTFSQASVLYEHYPNIIDLVISGEADNKVDLKKLKGIGEYTFNNIKSKITENFVLFDIVNLFKGSLTLGMVKKIYEKYPSVQKIKEELKKCPYKMLTSLSRVGFKTADAILLKMESDNAIKFNVDLKTSQDRCDAYIMFLLEENEKKNGNTKMNLIDLRKDVFTNVPECAKYFVQCLKENDEFYYNKEKMTVALKSTYQTELTCSNIIKEALKSSDKNNTWKFDWKSYQNKGEFPLTDEQISALKMVCDNQIGILSGFAGSGKTASTNAIIQMLDDNNKSYILMASTGKASKVLSEYTNRKATTIYRGCGFSPLLGWRYNKDNPLKTDIIIVDEFSMVDIFQFRHLLEAIDFTKTKLLIIGDPAQACSVGAGNCLNDMIESKVIPTVTLVKIFRYSDGGLMQAATDTRNGKVFLKEQKGFLQLGNSKDYLFLNCSNETIIDKCCKIYKQLLDRGVSANDIAVLTCQNKGDAGTNTLNKTLQKIVNKNYGSNKCYKYGDVVYYENDLIMQTSNNYKAVVYKEINNEEKEEVLIANGETGEIKEIRKDSNIIDFNNTDIEYTSADFNNVSLAYSFTIHKSQGSGIPYVILLTPSSHAYQLSANLLYVGLTRTKKQCIHLGDVKTVNRCLKKKDNLKRQTFLKDMLIAS